MGSTWYMTSPALHLLPRTSSSPSQIFKEPQNTLLMSQGFLWPPKTPSLPPLSPAHTGCTGASGMKTIQPSAWELGVCEQGQREGGAGGNLRGAEGTVMLEQPHASTTGTPVPRPLQKDTGHSPSHQPSRALLLAGDIWGTEAF